MLKLNSATKDHLQSHSSD